MGTGASCASRPQLAPLRCLRNPSLAGVFLGLAFRPPSISRLCAPILVCVGAFFKDELVYQFVKNFHGLLLFDDPIGP